MKLFKLTDEEIALDEAIADVLSEMKGLNADTEEYNAASDQLCKLMKLRKEIRPSWVPDVNTLIQGGASLLGILLIIKYEERHAITSKALSFIGRLR